MLWGGLIVGAIVGWLAGMWWAEQRRRPTSQWHEPQFYRHKTTGQGYWLQHRAQLRDDHRTDVVILSVFDAVPGEQRPERDEVWTVDELRQQFESYTPERLKS
jgi:hypothetical protein